MDPISWLIEAVDSLLIAPYRWPKNPIIGWWLGTVFVAMWCTILGEMTLSFAFWANRSHVKKVSQEMVERHNQSINALKAGNKDAYKAINKLANEAYSKTFFLQLAMASSSLWPVPLALAWMQTRFSGINFPLAFSAPVVGETIKYPFVFIPIYILSRIVFGKIKHYRTFRRVP